jgi:RHS repeat-associated protein
MLDMRFWNLFFVIWFAAANCFSHYSYDVHGNVNSLLQLIRHDGNVLAKTVDYEYDLISGKVNKVYYQKTKSDQLIHVYAYDGDNRITEVKTSTDGVLYSKEATYQYYAHGPLARTQVGELNVETQNYAYTVQGWIKQMQAEAFGYALGYNEKDYSAIGTVAILATPIAIENNKSKSLYNGNIASMTSKTPVLGTTDFKQQYSYDQLNRITASATPAAGNAYKTAYSYDANGNIKTLSRYDATGKFDELSYNYETKAAGYQRTTNKLRWVDDAAPVSVTSADIEDQSNDNYSYDAIGNLTKDNQEEIAKIEWTVSGKVKRVTRTASSSKPDLEFEYDASGQRIVKKVIRKDGSIASTYYLRDASGNVMSVYEYNSVSDDVPQLSEQYLYGSSRLGVYTPLGAGSITSAQGTVLGSRGFGRKSYELSDHLGNVRATLSDYRRLASAQIVNSATDYYPFGMAIPSRQYSSPNIYRYGQGGQEKDTDIGEGLYTAEYWEYDSRLGRRWNIDPILKPWISGYSCLSNSPIIMIDPKGDDDYFNADGTYKESNGTGTTIFINTSEGVKKLSELPTGTTQQNAVVLGILKYYASKVGYTGTIGISPNSSGGPFTLESGIYFPTKKGMHRLFDNFNNLKSGIHHEKIHYGKGDGKRFRDKQHPYTFRDHVEVYREQTNNALFEKTDLEFKTQIAASYAQFLAAAYDNKELTKKEYTKYVADFNEKNPNTIIDSQTLEGKPTISRILKTYENGKKTVIPDLAPARTPQAK